MRLAFLLLTTHTPLFGQVTFGPAFGPEGAAAFVLVRDSSGVVFAGGDGLFQSTNSGMTWTKTYSGLSFQCMAAAEAGVMYAGAGNGFYKSTNNGVSWAGAGLGIGPATLVLRLDLNGFVYAGTTYGVYRSTDAGATFTQQPVAPNHIYDLEVNDDGRLFACTSGGIFRSTDFGASWSPPDNGFGVFSLKKNSSGIYFAASPTGIYRSVDQCTSWTQVDQRFDAEEIAVTGDSTVFCGTYGSGVLRSTNLGESWEQANEGLDVNQILSFLSLGGDTLIAGTALGTYRTVDRGSVWTRHAGGQGFVQLHDLHVAPDGNLFAGTAGGVFRSSDGGVSWIVRNNGFENPDAYVIESTPDGLLFTGTPYGLFKSTDDGNQWTLMTNGIPADYVRAIRGIGNETVLAALNGGIYRTTDNGNSWIQEYDEFSIVGAFDVDDEGTVMAIESSRLLASTDAGDTWEERSRGLSTARDFAINRVGHIYVADDNVGTRRSIDRGKTWTLVSSAVNFAHHNHTVINSNGFVYVADSQGKTHLSANHGKDWSVANSDFSDMLEELALDSSGYLYAVTRNGGIFRSQQSTSPVPLPNVFLNTEFALGRKRISQQHDTVLSVYNAGGALFSVESVSTDDPVFSIDSTSFSVSAYSVFHDTIRFVLPALGPRNPEFTVTLDATPFNETVLGSVFGYGIPKVRFDPASIAFDSVDVNRRKDTTVWIYNIGDDTLKISGVEISLSAFSATALPAFLVAGDSLRDTVGFRAQAIGPVNGTLLLMTNAEEQDTLFLSGIGRSSPILTISRTYNFGTVSVNDTSYGFVRVDNTGTDTLRITNILLDNTTDFSVDETPLAIGPSLPDYIRVGFSPQNLGMLSTFVLLHNNSRTPVDTLFLTGTGDNAVLVEGPPEEVAVFALRQNYPNPFNPSTTIEFSIKERGFTVLSIYNVLGSLIETLIHENLDAGTYRHEWNAARYPSGVYFCRIQTGEFVDTRRIILLR